MSVTPSPIGGFAAQFFDNNGVILSGGKIYTYAAGTTTPQATYTSAAGATPHANPIVLDSAGRVPGGEIWLTDGLVYKFVIETSTAILIGTYDNITGVNSNFVNYTVQEEVQTATAGQTVFNLSTINYTPGTNSLSVYIDGVNQYVGDSYLETDSTTVTFTSGLHVGAEVKFTTAVQTTTGAVDASIVSFTGFNGQTGVVQDLAGNDGSDWIGFEQAGTGAIARSAQDKMRDVVSVKDFGAVGDGVADDTVAIQAALDSGAKQVVFPLGAYKTGALTIPNYMHLVGETMPQGIANGNGPVRLVFNLASGTAITCGFNPTFENITFKNTAGTYNDTTDTLSGTTAICIETVDDAQIFNCNFYFWQVCIGLGPSCFYFRSSNVEFARCSIGYQGLSSSPYDVNIESPTSRKTAIFFTAQNATPARNVKIFGGSIEGYSRVAENVIDLSIFGTYFETVATRAGCFAIEPGVNDAVVSIYGCLIYLNFTDRFVNMGGYDRCVITSSGNVFEGTAPASSYVFYYPDSGTVNLTGDRFAGSHPNSCRYVSSLDLNGAQNVCFPVLPSANILGAYSGVTLLGRGGYAMPALTAAPSSPPTGLTVLADGVSWDPLTRAYGRPYWVVWQGDRWRTPGGLT